MGPGAQTKPRAQSAPRDQVGPRAQSGPQGPEWAQGPTMGTCNIFRIFYVFFYLLVFYLYIYYFYAPEDIQSGKKLSNHAIKDHFRPLLGRFVAVFRSPHFLVFRSSRVPPSFFLTHPDQSVPCSDYSTLQIGYTNFFPNLTSLPLP